MPILLYSQSTKWNSKHWYQTHKISQQIHPLWSNNSIRKIHETFYNGSLMPVIMSEFWQFCTLWNEANNRWKPLIYDVAGWTSEISDLQKSVPQITKVCLCETGPKWTPISKNKPKQNRKQENGGMVCGHYHCGLKHTTANANYIRKSHFLF